MYILPCACSSIETSIDASTTTQNPTPSIKYSIGRNKSLGSRSRWGVRQCNVEVLQKWNICIGERNTSSFKHKNTVILRECGSQGTSSCATSYYYVIKPIAVSFWWIWWWERACTFDKWVSKFIEILLPCKSIDVLVKPRIFKFPFFSPNKLF